MSRRLSTCLWRRTMPGPGPGKAFRATPIDQFTHLDYRWNDGQMRMAITLDGRLDERLMERAVRLSLRQEPVLACRFVERAWRPEWAPVRVPPATPLCPVLPDGDAGTPPARPSGADGGAPSPALAAFLRAPMDFCAGPQVAVAIIRSDTDQLCVKMSHGAGDGPGLVEYTARLAATYRSLAAGDPVRVNDWEYRYARSLRAVWDGDLRTLVGSARRFRYPRPVSTFPQISQDFSGRAWRCRRVDPDRLTRIVAYARARGVSVGSVLLGAYYHALFTAVPRPNDLPVPVVVSVDLRRYLRPGRDWGIRPLAGWIFVSHGMRPATMDERIEEVHAQVAAGVKGREELARILFLETAAAMGFAPVRLIYRATQRWASRSLGPLPYFANFGVVDHGRFDFGERSTTAFTLFGMQYSLPGVSLATSTFRGALTVSVAFSDTAIDPATVEAFLDALIDALPA